jgi:hypothetical protein
MAIYVMILLPRQGIKLSLDIILGKDKLAKVEGNNGG